MMVGCEVDGPLWGRRTYLGGLPRTYDLEVILQYCGRSSYDLFASTLWRTRAYVGDLPMTYDVEVILKYCGGSSYDPRCQSRFEV